MELKVENEKRDIERKSHNYFGRLCGVVFFGVGVPLMGGFISYKFFSEWRFNHEPFHAVMEGSGALIAFAIIFLLFMEMDSYEERKNYDLIWFSSALISMGLLDIIHAGLHVGKSFVWFHSTATFAGGVFFALVWIPDRISKRLQYAPIFVGISTIIFSVYYLLQPQKIPLMVIEGEFNSLAKALNILGGTGFVAAFVFYVSRFLKNDSKRDVLLSSHCLLFGSAGILFEYSSLWDGGWWWWHLLRLLAYGVLIRYAFQNLQKRNDKMIVLNKNLFEKTERLKQQNKILEEKKRKISDINNLLLEEVSIRKKAVDEAEFKNRFLANMSHEIRTPMNSILGFTDILSKTRLDEKQKSHLRTVSTSGKLLLGIIDDILDISKLESGKVKLESTSFCLENLIIDVFKMIISRMKDRPFDTYIDIEDSVPKYVISDPTKLKQILVNLLGNAVKFTSQGSIGVLVTVEGENDKNSEYCFLRFKVKDTGIGIPKDKQAAVFESFTQADESTTRLYGGTGLGLSISKAIVKAMEGEIWIDSEEGKGSEFIFVIKIKRGEDVQEQTKGQLDGKCVFIIDDNAIARKIINKCCEGLGLKIIDIADSPHSALNKLDQIITSKGDIPDLFLCDIMMEGMDGYELVRKIKESENFKKAKYIAVTADIKAESSKKSTEEVFDAYITKPVNGKEMLGVITEVLGLVKKEEKKEDSEEKKGERCDGINVLIVEDVEANRMLMEAYCDQLGCKADYAFDGKEAVEKAKQKKYDLVLMDLQMPVMGGIEATEIIRDEVSKTLPIIALTAAVMKADQERATVAGMNDFLVKPIDIDKLREKILQYGCSDKTH